MKVDRNVGTQLAARQLARLAKATNRTQMEARLREGAVLPTAAATGDRTQALEVWIQDFFETHVRPHFITSKAAGLQPCLPALISGSGQPLDLSQLMVGTEVARLTVKKFVDCIEHTGALCVLRAFHGGHAKEITQTRISYFMETGLIEAARASSALPPLDASSLWRHAVVMALRARFGQVHYWRERKGPEMPCVVSSANDRPSTFMPDWEEGAFDPEPYRAFRVLHPLGENFRVVPHSASPAVEDAYGLPVHTITLHELLRPTKTA